MYSRQARSREDDDRSSNMTTRRWPDFGPNKVVKTLPGGNIIVEDKKAGEEPEAEKTTT